MSFRDAERLGRCPRCEMVDARRADEDPGYGPASEDEESSEFFTLKDCRVCGYGGVPRSSIKGGYYRRDLLEVIGEAPPRMGRPCLHCGARIPRFLDLDDEEYGRIFRLSRNENLDVAADALVAATGCPMSWARIWVSHPFGPRRPLRRWAGPPCPHCGMPLRTMLAQQCFECGKDWHDPENVRKLG